MVIDVNNFLHVNDSDDSDDHDNRI